MDPTDNFLHQDHCSGVMEIVLDVFVVTKAIVLIYFSGQGIRWFLKNKFEAISVIFILVISCLLVLSEMVFRFTDRSLRYRFVQNAVAQWSVFACLTVMLGFARKNDAAVQTVPIRKIFIPVHFLYATLLMWGIFNENMGQCTNRVYPNIFTYQYALFFLTYFGFVVLHKKGYCMKWHDSISHIDPTDEASHVFLDTETKRRLRVRVIFEAQGKRVFCFFTWLVFLTATAISFMTWQLKKNGGTAVGCAADGDHWLFADCGARFCLSFLHVFTTMQCAAMARVVFVKTVKKVQEMPSFVRMETRRELTAPDEGDFSAPTSLNGSEGNDEEYQREGGNNNHLN